MNRALAVVPVFFVVVGLIVGALLQLADRRDRAELARCRERVLDAYGWDPACEPGQVGEFVGDRWLICRCPSPALP